MFEIQNGQLKTSVRELVEFVYSAGDIDNRRGTGSNEIKAMQAGMKIHKKLQKSAGSGYAAEVPLKMECLIGTREKITLVLEGRADGIITDSQGQITIDEIKGMYQDVLAMEEPQYVHYAQAMCYAYIHGMDEGLEKISLRLTYANLDTEEVKYFPYEYSMKEVSKWFEDTLEKFQPWVDLLVELRKKRDESIAKVEFPFPYREGQKELVVNVFKVERLKTPLFIQAPTGVGKTLCTIFPTIKAMGEGLGNKLFYLTAKTITRTAAKNGMEQLYAKGLAFKTIILTAKEKTCPYELQCNPEGCPYAQGHFDRVNEAVFDAIHSLDVFDREEILNLSEKHKVCPYEFSLDLSYWCDAIICDYNYVFDPNAHLRRYFGDGSGGDYLFLVDESHNLVDRARGMYSAWLSIEHMKKLKSFFRGKDVRVSRSVNRVIKNLESLCQGMTEEFVVLDDITALTVYADDLMTEITRFLEVHRGEVSMEEVLEDFFGLRDFVNISGLLDEHYCVYARDLGKDFGVRLFCVDPSKNLEFYLNQANSTIFFSATLLPMPYYKSLLRGGEHEDYAIYAKSPFDPKKRGVFIATDVTTKYSMRGPKQYQRTYDYIKSVAQAKIGNYMVFFPSYRYLEDVSAFYVQEDFDILTQESNMSEEEREVFLNTFAVTQREKSLVGFCVMGGIFSEGIDLQADSLIGAIVVGTGLPQVNVEQSIIERWFAAEGKGFDYAYMYPGLNKVLQSAGRVIRTEADEGVVVLLDERFCKKEYQGLLPREWESIQYVTQDTVGKKIGDFWHNL